MGGSVEGTLPIWMEFLLVKVEGVVDTSEGWSALTLQVRVAAPDSLGSTSGVLNIDMECHAHKAWQFLGRPLLLSVTSPVATATPVRFKNSKSSLQKLKLSCRTRPPRLVASPKPRRRTMYATFLTLALATTAAGAPAIDRHAATRQAEAHQALIARHAQARQAAGALYQFTASRVVADRELAQRMTVDISSGLDAGQLEIGRIAELLTPTQREAATLRLQEVRDRQAHAVSRTNELKNELAKPRLDGGQIRFLTSEIYRSVSLAEDAHQALMRQLDVKLAGLGTARIR